MTTPLPVRRPVVLVASLLWSVLAMRPAFAQYRIFWGDMHGHTANSDGTGTLDDYFRYAKEVSKLDFVVISDHDFGNGPPWCMPQAVWKQTQDKADAYTVDGTFVAIAGYEWTSQPKYWTDVAQGSPSERLFAGQPKFFNHKNVYFPKKTDALFSAKDSAYMTPDLLAAAVQKQGGLIQNNHPISGPEGADQWAYAPVYYSVIANTEMSADTLLYKGKSYNIGVEQTARAFLNRGGMTGFVKGTDTHEGKPAARTAVLCKDLTRAALFDALRHRRAYAVTHARIVLSFKIDDHEMGETFETADKPTIAVRIEGTAAISEVAVIRDGAILTSSNPGVPHVAFSYVDKSFPGKSYYYLRVTQIDKDAEGNPSCAWSSPIWVNSQTLLP
ncbi:MAG TPA: CehA/McbA family metallohydrolase [Kiritimatiellia bacterium]|nr:CehA/McbA family metallohydrolase [Kiritimatiellia bacterium]HPS07175.1 CehA/McbA family metallohydrolase [Kiritimatiellia bacterium]